MNVELKIQRAKIALQRKRPFFSLLISQLQFKEDTSAHLTQDGVVVDHTGTIWYSEAYIRRIPLDLLQSAIYKWTLHMLFDHLNRGAQTNQFAWKIAIDLLVNDMLKKDGFQTHILSYDATGDEFHAKIQGHKVSVVDISKKSAEQIYLELMIQIPNLPQDMPEVFLFAPTKKEQRESWQKLYAQSETLFLNTGMDSGAQDRLFSLLGKKPQIQWNSILRHQIARTVHADYSFLRPNRKTRIAYLPSLQKKGVSVFVAIDTSGSISEKQLSLFLVEINSLVRTYTNIDLTVLDCDAEVYTHTKVKSLQGIKLKGGGGTSHKALFEYINSNRLRPKALICFTDGASDIESCQKPPYELFWVLPKQAKQPHFGKIIRMEGI